MSLVVIEDCDLTFGGRTIFAGLNLRIGDEDRIGLVGRHPRTEVSSSATPTGA